MVSCLATSQHSFGGRVRLRGCLRAFWFVLFGVALLLSFAGHRFLNCLGLSAEQLLLLLAVVAALSGGLDRSLVFLVGGVCEVAEHLLPLGCVGLVHLVLDVAHPFGLLDAVLFPFLVPAPFVDLTL